MTKVPEDSQQHQLFADELTTGDVSSLIDFNCGDEPWAKAATEWIIGSDVWESMKERKTRVWLYRNAADVVVGFGSLGFTRRRWPPPDGGHCNFLFIPMLGIDRCFRGQPPEERFRYSHQILSHLRYEAGKLLTVHQTEKRSTLPLLALLVHQNNARAIRLYEKFGFSIEPGASRGDQLMMIQRIDF